MGFASQLPEPVRLRAESLGEEGRAWMNGLDGLVEELCGQWRLSVGDVMSGGSESLILTARQEDDEPAILKLGLPGSSDLTKEAAVLELAGPDAYATLYQLDPQRNAMLVEALGQRLSQTDLAVEPQMRVICGVLKKSWISLDETHGFMTGEEKLTWLEDFIRKKWSVLNEPCEQTTIHQAYDYIAERKDAHDMSSCVLVHGDAHADNTLLSASGDYKFIDSDGLCAEKACDISALMRDWNAELLEGGYALMKARGRSELLAELTGVTEWSVWQWGSIERISTGLVMLDIGMIEEGKVFLAAADQLAERRR